METDALVLKVNDSGENDRIVTLLTSDYGVMRAFANRAKKMNSKMHSATQSMTYGTFSLYSGKDSYSISDASAKEVFFGLRNDITKLALGQYFCALAMELIPEMEPANKELRVILNSLHYLEMGTRSNDFLKAVTELKLMSLAGFMPNLENCPHCKDTEATEYVFNAEEGTIFCRASGKYGIRITPGILSAMRHICFSRIERLYSFTLSPSDEKTLSEISEKFMLAQIQKKFHALDFYNTVKE